MTNRIYFSSRTQYIAVLLLVTIGTVLSIAIAIFVWFKSEQQGLQLIKNTSQAKSELIEHQFTQSLPSVITALQRMRARWEAKGGASYEEWSLDGHNYVEHLQGLRAIEWVDTNYIVRWVVPLKGNEAAVDLDLTFERKRKAALDKARSTKTFTLSEPITLVQGGRGVLAYFPIFIGDEFHGFILGVFDIGKLINSLLPPGLLFEYNMEVYAENQVMYKTTETEEQFDLELGYEHNFKLYGLNWNIAIWPKQSRKDKDYSSIHSIAFLYAVFVTLLAGTTVFYFIRLKSAQRLLKDKGSEFKATLDNVLDGIVTIDSRGKIKTINKSVERIFGRTEKQLVGKNVKVLMPEPDRGNHDTYIKNYETTHVPKIIGKGRQVEGLRCDGSTFPLDLGITEFFVEGEKVYCGVIRDITERVELQKQREQLINQLTKSNEELDNFAYIASHDLKEPLRAIQNHSSFLLEDYQNKLDEEGVYKLHRLIYLSSRMEQLIADLLYYSRLGREDMCLSCFSMFDVAMDVVARLEEQFIQFNVEVEVKELPEIYGDKVRLQELIYNLVTNAYKYNDSERKKIEIGFDQTLTPPAFYVQDNGIGIDPNFAQEAFRIFKRLHSVKKFAEGSGAGLTFSKKIVEQHGGTIWFEPAPDKGTRFYFTIRNENG